MSQGRLIKKAQQEKNDHLQVDSYPWKEFSPETILLPDNPRKSVVLAKSHPSQELTSKVQKPNEFSRTFGQPAKPITPQDMTSEFLASQEELRRRKRRMQMDDDEAVALELLDLEAAQNSRQQRSSDNDSNSQSTEHENDTVAAISAPKARSASPDISDLSALTSHRNKGLDGNGLDFTRLQITQEKLDAEVKAAFERGLAEGLHSGERSGYERALSENAAASVSAVQPQIVPDEEANKQNYDKGFQAGVEQGRSEAMQQAEQQFNHSMQLFTKALSELQHLKGELLSTGREIFSEIVQMCADKILRKHIQWNDEALKNVFSAAMGQFQAQDELKIEMHPEDITRLEQQIPENQRTKLRLIANSKLSRGDIKIEANNEVVSFDIQRTVESVIDSLKDELFEEPKKDDSTEKAG